MRKILRMKKLMVAIVLAVAFGLGSWMVTPAEAQQILNLKATWTPMSYSPAGEARGP